MPRLAPDGFSVSSSLVFTGGTIHTLAPGPRPDWVLIEGQRIAATGRGDVPAADRRVHLDGAVLVPAFCDAHVHLSVTGLYEAGMDFRGERSATAVADAFARRAVTEEAILFGGNFEDPLDVPLTRRELDAAVGDRPALLARADMHSCVVSTALLKRLDVSSLAGVDRDDDGDPTGYLREQAAARAWMWFDAHLPRRQQRDALEAAVRLAYSKGVATVHEMFVAEWRGWDSFEALLEDAHPHALEIVPYVATTDVDRVRELRLPRIGGDFFLDGSFGSHTAWMAAPYASAPPAGTPDTGIRYRDDDDLYEFFTEAQAAGLQVGVHAIGDAAIEQAIRTWERVAGRAGTDEVRALGHRVEHFECSSDDHIARAMRLGLRASVQPAFDRFWGGSDGLYARRIGWERAHTMNRFKSMAAAGLTVGAGSDSTVTPLDPFLQMAALRSHHVPAESVDAVDALRLVTVGAHALAAQQRDRGSIAAGKRAHLAAVDRDPLAASPDELPAAEVVGTWISGRRVWPPGEAEVS